MSRLLQLPVELLDIVFGACFLEGWANSNATCDLALRPRLVSRACDLSIRRIISTDPSLRSDHDAQKAFWKALFKGSPAVIIRQMFDRADVDGYGQTLLLGGSLGDGLRNGITALHFAAATGRVALVSLFLEKGADIEAKDLWYSTPLHEVVFRGSGSAAVLEMLLDKGAVVDEKGYFGHRALHYAAEKGNAVLVQKLLEKGADTNAKADNDFTALHYAAARGYKTVVRLLLEKGADINAQNWHWETPLDTAEANGCAAGVRMLLEKGADVDSQND